LPPDFTSFGGQGAETSTEGDWIENAIRVARQMGEIQKATGGPEQAPRAPVPPQQIQQQPDVPWKRHLAAALDGAMMLATVLANKKRRGRGQLTKPIPRAEITEGRTAERERIEQENYERAMKQYTAASTGRHRRRTRSRLRSRQRSPVRALPMQGCGQRRCGQVPPSLRRELRPGLVDRPRATRAPGWRCPASRRTRQLSR
jgi:hypothetical protein